MDFLTAKSLAAYWSGPIVASNIVIFLNLLGALLLGLLVGYERSFHGRAAGMRTYGVVCMASAALTVFVGYSALWYGGHAVTTTSVDPTRVVQGIVTGIGFLGAGVIVKEGFSIGGLEHRRLALGIVGNRRDGRRGPLCRRDNACGAVRTVYDPALRLGTSAAVAKRSRDCSAERAHAF